MTVRPVFQIVGKKIERKDIEFEMVNGFDLESRQKSIYALHKAFKAKYPKSSVLEVSTKSTNPIGKSLSAFNLKVQTKRGYTTSVESAFQSSKVFTGGVQYSDLLFASPLDAKKDTRLRNSGEIIYFSLEGEKFEKDPKTFFYDWVYINALAKKPSLLAELSHYDAFTDIEFNPFKSVNCQAEAVALAVMLNKNNALDHALSDKNIFKEIIENMGI